MFVSYGCVLAQAGFSPSASTVPCRNLFISAPYSSSCYQSDKRAKPGNLPKISFWNRGSLDRNVLHLVFVSTGNGQACTPFRDSTSTLTDSSIQSTDNIWSGGPGGARHKDGLLHWPTDCQTEGDLHLISSWHRQLRTINTTAPVH
jgi:hypothetical protein